MNKTEYTDTLPIGSSNDLIGVGTYLVVDRLERNGSIRGLGLGVTSHKGRSWLMVVVWDHVSS